MKLEIEFDADKLINAIMENYPEASSPSLRCINYKYKTCTFQFWDVETTHDSLNESRIAAEIVPVLQLGFGAPIIKAVVYKVTRADLQAGLEILLKLMVAGKLKGISQHVLRNDKEICWQRYNKGQKGRVNKNER